jgi:tRNA(adenine34) deaminase
MHEIVRTPEAPHALARQSAANGRRGRTLRQALGLFFDHPILKRHRVRLTREYSRGTSHDEAGCSGNHETADGFAVREKQSDAAIEISQRTTDKVMMARCIELSRSAASKGEYPFGTVIALDRQIVAEGINSTIRGGDVTRHAEIVALSHAQKTVGREQLRRYTLYSNIEPCAMCAYCIREAGVSRVVYALGSPVMGGLSKWNVLRDDGLSDRIPEIFGAVPEVVSGVLLCEAQQAWRDWSPFVWEMIKLRGLLTAPCGQEGNIRVQPGHSRSLWHYLHILLMRSCQARIKTGSR